MGSPLVVALLVALASGHFVVANDQPAPASLGKSVFGNIIDVLTRGFRESPHIVGGVEAWPHSHPYQAYLWIQKTKQKLFQCGGSLVAPQWVLTAAHCTDDAEKMIVILGSHDVTAPEKKERQVIRVTAYAKHPHYDPPDVTDDIALLRLKKPATLNRYVQPIRLPSLKLSYDGPEPDTPVVLTGWGRVTDSNQEVSPVLRSVKTRLLSNGRCSYLFAHWIPDSILCASGAHRRGVCEGDSGGPMIMTESDGRKTIIGVASFVSKEGCEKGFPSAFTRVDLNLPWIASTTGIKLRRM